MSRMKKHKTNPKLEFTKWHNVLDTSCDSERPLNIEASLHCCNFCENDADRWLHVAPYKNNGTESVKNQPGFLATGCHNCNMQVTYLIHNGTGDMRKANFKVNYVLIPISK